MVKLFLTSQWLLPAFHGEFERLAGKNLVGLRTALIENGADDEEGDPRWVRNARQSLVDAGMAVTRVDLREYLAGGASKIEEVLDGQDVIWVGGGNTFYLNWILRKSGAAKVIKRLVEAGTIYGGGSAGAIVAGPTVEGFEEADDASFAPELILDGMALIDEVVLPHWGRDDFGPIMARAEKVLASRGYATMRLTDKQAYIVADNKKRVV